MRNAAKVLVLSLGRRHSPPATASSSNDTTNQDMSIDDNLTSSQLRANAEIETLPPDESSETSNGELANGQDNPDVNDIRQQPLREGAADEALLFAGRLLARRRTSCSTRSASITTPSASTSRPRRSRTEATISKINPKGAVPALELDSGEVLTENAVILQYLGDRASWPEVLPPIGDFRRYRVLEMVNFITTELHKRFGFLFNPERDRRNEAAGHRASSARSSTISTNGSAPGRSCSATNSRCPTPICS